MKRNRSIGGLLGLLVAGTAMAMVPSLAYATDSNHEDYWENQEGEICKKVDDKGTEEGGYTVPAEPDGYDWSTLIIKKGSGADQNYVVENPEAGTTYFWQGQNKGYSHVILCKVPEPEPEPTDVCPNIEGDQATVPPGMIVDEDGKCVTETPPPPADVCPNIPGDQATVPPGMVIDEDGKCVTETPPPPADVCPNIPGDQATVPPGMVVDANGNCVTQTPPPPAPTDVCPNIEGVQTSVPAGMVQNADGDCVSDTDVLGEEEPEPNNPGNNNGGNNGGNENEGPDTEVLGEQASAPVPTVINAGVSGPVSESGSIWTSAAMLTLLAALLGLLALGARAISAPAGRHQV